MGKCPIGAETLVTHYRNRLPERFALIMVNLRLTVVGCVSKRRAKRWIAPYTGRDTWFEVR